MAQLVTVKGYMSLAVHWHFWCDNWAKPSILSAVQCDDNNSLGQLMSHPLNWPSFQQRGKQKSVDWYRFTASSDNVSIYWYDTVILHVSETSK